MPPSRHSSSSHSSRSHSSSRSRSSSSRSHSRSSHSSRSHSSSSSGFSHSYTSSSSDWTSPYVSGNRVGRIIQRNMVNQPSGYNYMTHGGIKPTRHYCVNHNYTYFPTDWIDDATGISYRKGYYDENGTHYPDVVFKKNGKYSNILCHCDYCNSEIHTDWEQDKVLECPSCGANMRIVSFLDEYTQDPHYTRATELKKSYKVVGSIIAGILIAFLSPFILVMALFMAFERGNKNAQQINDNKYSSDNNTETVSDTDIFGTTVYLKSTGNGEYEIVESADDYDKKMTWDYGYKSYYEKDSDCYLWYNTDVSPNLWQYYYEGISSDYGDYGWMEYEPTGWYIEQSEGNWIELPDKYDDSNLWHIEIDEKDFD